MKEYETLQLFNEKAKELRDGNFYKYLQEHKSIGIRIGGKLKPGVETEWPDEDAIKSFILTLRFFIRDRDGCSFRCLSKIYTNLPIPKELKDKYKEIHESINNYLDDNIHVKILTIGRSLKNREILDVFTYGRYAHSNPRKRKKLEKWSASPLTELILKYEYLCILNGICDIIPYVVQLNNEALNYIKKSENQ